MTRRTIVITGASDGIGAAAARRLRRSGRNVVVVGRSESKTAAVAAELDADYFVADFADLSQVRALADKIRSQYPRIDVSGQQRRRHVHQDPRDRRRSRDNFSGQLPGAVSAHHAVDGCAASSPAPLSSTRPARRINCFPESAIDDLENTAGAGPALPSAFTKLAIVLFTRELHRRYHASGLSAATFHPGYVDSNFGDGIGIAVSHAS